MLLKVETDLKKEDGARIVEIVLSSKEGDIVHEIHRASAGDFLVKSGGGKKGGRRLGASLRRKVIKHLEDGGRVDLVVPTVPSIAGVAHQWLR